MLKIFIIWLAHVYTYSIGSTGAPHCPALGTNDAFSFGALVRLFSIRWLEDHHFGFTKTVTVQKDWWVDAIHSYLILAGYFGFPFSFIQATLHQMPKPCMMANDFGSVCIRGTLCHLLEHMLQLGSLTKFDSFFTDR